MAKRRKQIIRQHMKRQEHRELDRQWAQPVRADTPGGAPRRDRGNKLGLRRRRQIAELMDNADNAK